MRKSLNTNSETKVLRYKLSTDAWQTKVQVLMHLPFPLPWILIASVLFAVGYAIILFSGEDIERVRLLAIDCALIASIANSVVFFEILLDNVADTFPSLLDEDKEKAELWINQWYQNIFWSKKNILMGFALGIVCSCFGIIEASKLFEFTIGKSYIFFILFVIGFLGGSMFWTMIGIARLTSSLGKDVQIKPSLFDTKTSVLRAASSVIWKASIIASLVYSLGMSTYYFCDLQINTSILLIVIFFGLFIILYFIVPQLNIRKSLVEIKRTRLSALVNQIETSFDKVSEVPTAENINQLRDLFQLQGIVNRKKSWPFGLNELLVLIGTVLIPLLLFLIDHYVRK